jgi:hypothetical protein
MNHRLRPAIHAGLVSDQFAFRPAGSTTRMLVYFMHRVTRLLGNNDYLRCLLTDFSKAFDRVDHNILLDKLKKLPLPDNILKWFISFLTGRSHTTRYNGVESNHIPINLSIVQGSGLEPTFCTLARDLRPVSTVNVIFKYSDDTNLLVSEHTDVELDVELVAINVSSTKNKMVIKYSKTKEIVFYRPNPHSFSPRH